MIRTFALAAILTLVAAPAMAVSFCHMPQSPGAYAQIGAGIKQVKFDRGHYKYHGRIAALADAAREAGLSL